jgi:hypothetical protein
MIRSVAAGLIISTMCAISSPADARWYISHAGPEACVPIDDIDPNDLTRLYYGAGQMHTPDDFVSAMRSMGMRIKEEKSPLPSTHIYIASASGTKITTMFVLFSDNDICQATMATLEK